MIKKTTSPMKYDVFISYSREDLQQIESFVKDIEQKADIKCWIDWTGIESGSQFEDVIVKAIDSVDIVLFFISENSINSNYAKKEISYAYNTNKRVVPIVLDGGNLRGWFLFKFGDIDYIDIHQPRQCEKLVRNLRTWCGVKPQESKPIIPQSQPAAAKTYKVGDYYNENGKEGVVFDVWDGGKHGKIVSLDEDEELLQWCTESQYYKKIVVGTTSKTDGKANTDKVMARADSAEYPAFVWCRNKGKDWYLPAIEELRLLLCNKSVYGTVNKTLESRGAAELRNRGYKSHWSSTEFINEEPEYLAWVVWMYGGPTNALVKSRQCNVRAVSAF